MTKTITDENYYNEHAALLGGVTLAWNDCHYMVLSIFHTLSGLSCGTEFDDFLALKFDHLRRKRTLERMKEVLNTENDLDMRECGIQLLDQLSKLTGDRNVATHTMWALTMPARSEPEFQPRSGLPWPKNLDTDFKSQFSNLTT